MHLVARTRRITGADELLFLLVWSTRYIGSKIGLPLSGTFNLLFFRHVIAVPLVGACVSLRSECYWPDRRRLLIGFLGYFLWLITFLKAFEFFISAGLAALIAVIQPVFDELFSVLRFVGSLITTGGLLLIHRGERTSAHQTG